MKKFFTFIFQRGIVIILMLIQIVLLILMVVRFNRYFVYFYAISTVIGVIIFFYIMNTNSNPAYKLAWIIPLILVPIYGGMFFIIFGVNRISNKRREKIMVTREKQKRALYLENPLSPEDLEDPRAVNQCRYNVNCCDFPPYKNNRAEYFSLGEHIFERMKEELLKAERYIFMEYFIIEAGLMWNSILEILKEKAAAGVDVRVIYDDMGCFFTLPYNYSKKLAALGIKCAVFNPFVPVLDSRFNNRSHRKICVIDGHTAFTGGINLADEYINAIVKHGHWKDGGIMFKGEAAWGFTVMFLGMWDNIRPEQNDFLFYKPSGDTPVHYPDQGYVQPYGDTPGDDDPVGEMVYMNMINRAEKYVYITTPYLIIDNELRTALSVAARSGIDVRIITPHIGDKWYVHEVTISNYAVLLKEGVRIYEYTPGFIHAKTAVSDDLYGNVGTVNLDYRSLYLHFECGAYMYNTPAIQPLKEDFLKTLGECKEIIYEEFKKTPWYRRTLWSVLKLFAPLM